MTEAGKTDLDRWAEIIVGRARRPVDAWAVAALLESEGLRDVDARERFGVADIFELATLVYDRAVLLPVAPVARASTTDARGGLERAATDLGLGALFVLPLIGQVACILFTGYSLWASLHFTPREATIVGVATVASFVGGGGLVTAIGRQGSVYRSQRAYALLRDALTQLVTFGLAFTVTAVAAVAAFWAISPVLDGPLFLPGLFYFGALMTLWISMATLFALGSHVVSFALTMTGAFGVAALVQWLGLNVVVAQTLAILVVACVGLMHASRRMRILAASDVAGKTAIAIPNDTHLGMLLPYAAYGVAYFGLLFSDRAIAWTTELQLLPQPVWFHAGYEVAIDWAMCSLLLPMAYIEHAMREFGRRIEKNQREVSASNVGEHRRVMGEFCVRAVVILLVLSVVSVTATYAAGIALAPHVAGMEAVTSLHVTQRIYWQAAAGYQMLVFGLLGATLLIVLNRILDVVAATVGAFLIAVLVGLAASRLLGAEWASLGLLAGTATLAIQTLRAGLRVVSAIDFFYYAAF